MRTIASLEKGLKVLEFAAHAENGVKIADIARMLEAPSSNTSLFVNTLVHCGYLIKHDATGNYQVTTKLRELAQQSHVDLFDQLKVLAHPAMESLHSEYDENVILSVLTKDKLSSIAEIPSTQAIRIINREKDLFVPHVTAAGKAILAFSPQTTQDQYLKHASFSSLTGQSLKNKTALTKEVEAIRSQGWAVNRGEYEDHIYGVAAPILHHDEAVAALVVQYPSFRHDESKLDHYGKTVAKAASAVSDSLNR